MLCWRKLLENYIYIYIYSINTQRDDFIETMGNFDCFRDSYYGVSLFHSRHPDTERCYVQKLLYYVTRDSGPKDLSHTQRKWHNFPEQRSPEIDERVADKKLYLGSETVDLLLGSLTDSNYNNFFPCMVPPLMTDNLQLFTSQGIYKCNQIFF